MKPLIQSLRKLFSWSLKAVVLCLLLAITVSIGIVSASYFPPDFSHGFLMDKQPFFNGIYAAGLYAHIFTAPLLIALCSLLIFFRLEIRFPKMHRLLGRTVFWTGFVLFVPSGFILASHAFGGWKGISLFYMLSSLSATSLFFGCYFARRGKTDRHRRWMFRFYIFLISAIFLRINKFILGYYFNFFGEDSYLLSVVLSFFPQWLVLEMVFQVERRLNK